ncbi:MAG TPA: CBS domain-containing protein [Gemmatimonadales bacterium]|nr:CBS domain-containing protein [Gemmatimonadales bacterium]
MRVADVMQRNLRVIRGTDTVGDAITLLAENHVSGVPVVDDHGRLVGVLSSSDILETLAEHAEPAEREQIFDETLVSEIMTPRPQTIGSTAALRDAAQRMLYLEVHRLFVEDEGKLVGVVSTTDLVRAMAGQKV